MSKGKNHGIPARFLSAKSQHAFRCGLCSCSDGRSCSPGTIACLDFGYFAAATEIPTIYIYNYIIIYIYTIYIYPS
jgi:hypothetical protein